jgi:hypothetical protein
VELVIKSVAGLLVTLSATLTTPSNGTLSKARSTQIDEDCKRYFRGDL